MASVLRAAYPWVKAPLLASAPMLGAATPELAVSVSRAGGVGFIAGGTKFETLDKALNDVSSLLDSFDRSVPCVPGTLPIGVGFQNWSCDISIAAAAIRKHVPAIAWLFAPSHVDELRNWSQELRAASEGKTRIWIQVGSVQEARQAVELAKPDVLVLQGTDAGGHGLSQSASVISLIPETLDVLAANGTTNTSILAAGGIVEGRGMAGALALGAAGAVMGTRFLAAEEAGIARGWQREILRTSDGGVSTTRSTLGDRLRETVGWPPSYDGRMIVNRAHADEIAGLPDHEQIAIYKQELSQGDEAWGPHGRMITYAGTGVGLIKEIKPAATIVDEVLADGRNAIGRAAAIYTNGGVGAKL